MFLDKAFLDQQSLNGISTTTLDVSCVFYSDPALKMYLLSLQEESNRHFVVKLLEDHDNHLFVSAQDPGLLAWLQQVRCRVGLSLLVSCIF